VGQKKTKTVKLHSPKKLTKRKVEVAEIEELPTRRKREVPKRNWRFEQLSRNVYQVTVPYKENKEFEWYFLVTSDQHWDNPCSDHKLQLKHLRQAKERDAGIMSAGDLLCLMQGKYDRRSNKSSLRPEHRTDNYLDDVITTAADFFEPFAHQFVVLATGNHEDSIRDRYETNMIDRLVGTINDRTGSHIGSGGFSGWVIFRFERPDRTSNRIVLHYDHGYGGGGPVTADMIQHQRRSVYLPDAHIVVSGHTHDQWQRETARVRLGQNGLIYKDIQTHIKLPSYKDEYKDGYGGWANTRGMPPKPIGAWWLRFFWDTDQQRMAYEVIRAQ